MEQRDVIGKRNGTEQRDLIGQEDVTGQEVIRQKDMTGQEVVRQEDVTGQEKMNRKYLKQEMMRVGFEPSIEQLQSFMEYYQLLISWNEVMNLTAITEFHEVVMKHFVDSLMIGQQLGWKQDQKGKLLDLGTGAGFPGIPLRIMYPELEICLMDSLNKRIRFLNEVIGKLGLSKIEAVHKRAEEWGRSKEARENFDLCVSRAVANLSSLSEFCLPFVKKGGCFISYKSGQVDEELEKAKNAISLLGGKVKKLERFEIGQGEMERTLVVIDKVRETPKKYPRQGGKPLKEPL